MAEPEIVAVEIDPADQEEAERLASLVPISDAPPTVLPAVLLDDFVPFPGGMVPVLLDEPDRRDAVLHAKSNHQHVLLINRRPQPEQPSTS